MRSTLLLLTLVVVSMPGQSFAQQHGPAAPDSISFQGYLTDTGGNPITTPTNLTFKLYKGPTLVWSQTKIGVPVSDGFFNVILGGAGAASLDSVSFDEPIDLGITVETDAEISPRTPLTAAPFALGMRGMYASNVSSFDDAGVNLIGGSSNNYVAAGVIGATIGGGGGTWNGDAVPDSVTGSWGTVAGGANNLANAFAAVAGGEANAAKGAYAAIGGGRANVASQYGTIGGGHDNVVSGTNTSIGGGSENSATGDGATIGGGNGNTATDVRTTVSGGGDNVASDVHATVSGGTTNMATAYGATVSGGSQNTASGVYSVVSGGADNQALSLHSVVSGGWENAASQDRSSIGGGWGNQAKASFAHIGGGQQNVAGGVFATVPGGYQDKAQGDFSLAAGYRAQALHDGSFVWNDRSVTSGDDSLLTTGDNQFLIRAAGGVGIGTNAPTSPLTVAGMIESKNQGFKFPDGSVQSTAAGGSALWSLIGNAGTIPGTNFLGTTDSTAMEIRVNGTRRMIIDPVANSNGITPNVILGASNNVVTAGVVGATISGGGGIKVPAFDKHNEITADYGTVGGGFDNSAGLYSIVGGGWQNSASGESAAIAGGIGNEASGYRSTVPGGAFNTAEGDYSFAAGRFGDAIHDGTWVWASSPDPVSDHFTSTGPNQFLLRAVGGVGIGTNAPLGSVDIRESNWKLDAASILSDDLVIESTDAILGLYSPQIGAWGSAVVLGEVDNSTGDLHDKWSILREAGSGNALHFKFGSDANYSTNTTVFRIGINSVITARALIQPWTDDMYDLGTASLRWQDIHLVNAPSVTSDARLKTDVRNLGYGLEDVLKLRPISFRWIKHPDSGQNLGLIAQEVENVIPEVVDHPEDSSEPLSLQYSELIPVLIKAIQEQQQIIASQGRRLAELEARVRN